MTITYSNPRMSAIIEDWPSGQHRVTATFKVEVKPGKGERATRTTTDPRTGKPAAVKVLTFARKARIVDGSDGRTYLAMLTDYGHVSIMRGDMKISEEAIFEKDPHYAAVLALFD